MAGVAGRIVEVLLAKGLHQADEVPSLMTDLLLRHKLAPDRDKGWFVSRLASAVTEVGPLPLPLSDRVWAPR